MRQERLDTAEENLSELKDNQKLNREGDGTYKRGSDLKLRTHIANQNSGRRQKKDEGEAVPEEELPKLIKDRILT